MVIMVCKFSCNETFFFDLLYVLFSESYAESNCYYRKISKFKKLYELLDDLGSVNIKIADLGNACWEVIIQFFLNNICLYIFSTRRIENQLF